MIYESERVAATYEAGLIHITLKALDKVATVSAEDEPMPVTGKLADACRAKGIDPDTRRVYGRMAGAAVIPAEDAEAIRAAVLALPEYQHDSLRQQRDNLRDQIKYVLDGIEDARERAFDTDIGGIPSYDSPEYRAACAKLHEFDAAHPEIAAAIEAEREASIQRHMWD